MQTYLTSHGNSEGIKHVGGEKHWIWVKGLISLDTYGGKKHQMGTQGFKLFLAVRDMHSVPTFSHHCKNLQIGDNFDFGSNWHLINIGPKQSWSHYINFDFIAISTTSPHQLLIS
jgi:hypothetical protein